MRRTQILAGDIGTHGGSVRVLNASAPGIIGQDGNIRRKASIDDQYDCPIHGSVPIISGSAFLRAGDRAVACEGDSTACGATLIAQSWAPVEEDGATEKTPVGRTPGDSILDRIIIAQSEPDHCPVFSRLLQEWRDGPAFTVAGQADHRYLDNTTITMDWIRQFERERHFIDHDIAPRFSQAAPLDVAIPWLDTPNNNGTTPRGELGLLLARFAPNIKIGESVSLLPADVSPEFIRQTSRGLRWIRRDVPYSELLGVVRGRPDCLTMALANFVYRVALEGTATRLVDRGEQRLYKIRPTSILIFVDDSFDFNGDQNLWYWNQDNGNIMSVGDISSNLNIFNYNKIFYLDNQWFRLYRDKEHRGCDFKILSDMMRIPLNLNKNNDSFICRGPNTTSSPIFMAYLEQIPKLF